MDGGNNGSSACEKVFRTHRICLIKPVAVGLLCSGLILGASMLIGLKRAPWLPVVGIVPLIPIGWRFLAWRANRYVFRNGRLVHEWGILRHNERALNYSFAHWTFKQSIWDKLLDRGNVELGLGANPDKLERIGRFREFKSILTSGQSPASAQPVFHLTQVVFISPEGESIAWSTPRPSPLKRERRVLDYDGGGYDNRGDPSTNRRPFECHWSFRTPRRP